MQPPFIKFPRTPHLCWLGKETPRDDKVLSKHDAESFLSSPLIIIQEKVDGANIGISFDEDGNVWTQSRGDYFGPCIFRKSPPQFGPLWEWIEERRERLWDVLGSDYILFGEWCFVEHSIHYNGLPDWFLAYDLYHRGLHQFEAPDLALVHCHQAGVKMVPDIGLLTGGGILDVLLPYVSGCSVSVSNRSRITDRPMEGLYLRTIDRSEQLLVSRTKLVNPAFTLAIDEHWTKRPLIRNERINPQCQ